MKIDDIDAFVAVVQCQSLSQAAEVLQLTQPAVTRRVQSFEEALGVELLDRNTKPPKPTAMGRLVYEQCRAVLREIAALRDLVAADRPPAGTLRLGLTQGIGDLVLPGVLDELQRSYAGLDVRVATAWGNTLLERVDQDELDAAVLLTPALKVLPRHVAGRSLASTRLVVVARQGTFTKRSYRLADLYEHGWILNPDGCGFRAGLQRALASQGLPFQLRLDSYGQDQQLALVAQGRGLGLVPAPLLARSPHRHAVEVVPVRDFQPVVDLWLVHRRGIGRLQQAVDAFGASVRRAFECQTSHRGTH